MSEKSFLEKSREMNPREKEDIVRKAERTAYYYERTYGGCARCVLRAIQETLQLEDGLLFKAADPMTGGVALNGEACGSLIGGVLAIGLAYGRDDWESALAPWYETSPTGTLAKERACRFTDAFKKHFGSLKCCDVQKVVFGRSFNLRNSKEAEEFCRPDIHDKCGDVAKLAARLATEIILEPI